MSDYIMEMRKLIGHNPLLTIGCDVIIENKTGDILLQKRTDDGEWCVPGGSMNFGETFIEAATREVMEETGLTVEELSLFGIYSGKNCVVEYPNKDVVLAESLFSKHKNTAESFLRILMKVRSLGFLIKKVFRITFVTHIKYG